MEEKKENPQMAEENIKNEESCERENAQESEQTASDSSFYTGELPDPMVRAAYDPFNGKDPAALLAQLVGREEEEEAQEEMPKKRGFLVPVFGALLALLCAAAFLLRSLALHPPIEPAATPSPSPSASPDASPTPAPTLAPAAQIVLPAALETPAPTEPLLQSYERTALVVDGRVMGVLVSREAAETLLRDVCVYFEEKVRADYEISEDAVLETEIENEIEFRPAPETAEEELDAAEALFEKLSAKNTRLDVITTEKSGVVEIVKAKTKEIDDKYLLKGTSIVEDPGCDGSVITERSVTYKNGKKKRESEKETTTEQEARERVVRVGTQKIKDDDAPGKREGKKGREAEGLSFQAPVEDGKILSNYGQQGGVLHLGLDYVSEEDSPRVLASCAGTVVCKMERGGYGLMVEIDHGQGFVTRYAHLREAPVNVGDYVNAGDAIGIMGGSGNADGICLHFELRIDGEAYNPRYYIE